MSNISTPGGFTLSVNSEQFLQTFRQYVTLRIKETLHGIINRKLLFLGRRARALTPIADRSKILSDLGATSTQKISKSGKVRNSNRYNQNSSAVNIIQWRRRKKGLDPLTQKEAKKAASEMTAKRLSGVGALKAGWVKGLILLAKACGEPVTDKQEARLKTPGSTAVIAKPGWNPVATLEYTMAIRKGDSEERFIDPRLEAAANQALAEEERSMREYIEKKLMEKIPQLTRS